MIWSGRLSRPPPIKSMKQCRQVLRIKEHDAFLILVNRGRRPPNPLTHTIAHDSGSRLDPASRVWASHNSQRELWLWCRVELRRIRPLPLGGRRGHARKSRRVQATLTEEMYGGARGFSRISDLAIAWERSGRLTRRSNGSLARSKGGSDGTWRSLRN